MSNTITVTARSSNTIAAEIVAITNQTKQMLVMSAIEVGKRLEEAKSLVGHGEWGDFVKQECQMSHRSANNCMKLFREWQANPNSQALANMSYTNAVRLLSLPEDDREELMQEHDVSQMSSRELDKVIKERDEARAAQEASDAQVRELQQKILDAEQRAASAKSSEAAWQEEIDKLKATAASAADAATKAKNQVQYLKEHPTIPKPMKDKLVSEAREQVAKEMEKEMQTKISAAEREAKAAAEARAAAEKDAQDIREQLAAAQKQFRFSSPDAAAIKILFDQIQSDFNRVNGHLLKLTKSDPEQGAKFKNALRVLVEEMRKRVE